MVRITKDPAERRQEIIDTATKLFYKKGYEKTSITDIAKEMNVAQGLCYRYFPSKEALFDTVIEQYAEMQVSQMTAILKNSDIPLEQFILQMPNFQDIEKNNSAAYELCHSPENKKMHDQLALCICNKMLPIVKKMLDSAKERGELNLEDTEIVASFCVFGPLGVLLRQDIPAIERNRRIRSFYLELLQKF